MVKTLIRIFINTAVGLVLIYFWLKIVNIDEVLQALEGFNPAILIPAVVFFGLASILKALRFKILLSKVVNIPAGKVINLTFLSQLLSFTIPIRLGEVAKGVYLSSEYGIHFGKAVVWVFLDRFLDFWAVLALSLLLLLIVPTDLPSNMISLLLACVISASSLVIMIVLKPEYFRHITKLLSVLFITKFLKSRFLGLSFFMIDCFALLKNSPGKNLAILTLSVLAAFTEGVCWYLILYAFFPGLSILKVWLGSMLTALTFIIPAAPGYVGSAEAAGLAVFSYGLGLDKTFVSAGTIVFHALSLVFILSSGIFGLYMLKFNLKLVWRKLLKKEN